jgi:hypothetical protein
MKHVADLTPVEVVEAPDIAAAERAARFVKRSIAAKRGWETRRWRQHWNRVREWSQCDCTATRHSFIVGRRPHRLGHL